MARCHRISFFFCVEGLSQALSEAASSDQIHGCKVSVNAPPVTYLLFANDNFLFFKADVNETRVIKESLNRYECMSGQSVNYQKSRVFFSANVRRDKQQELRDILGVQNELGDSRYLGRTSLVGRSKKNVFKFVKDRVFKKVQGWSNKILSRARKTILIKNVAQSMPSYCMTCFLIPKSLYEEIEKIMNGFWWQSNGNNNKGLRWHSWDKMCVSKSNGGLGFRSLHGFNMALLGKQVWNFMQKPSALVTRIYKARYFEDRDILHANKGTDPRFVWSGLWEAKEQLVGGFRWI